MIEEPKLTDKQRSDHIARVEWNMNILKILGLTLRKSTRQIYQLSVDQGEVTLFSAYITVKSDYAKFSLHVDLQNFLKRYIKVLNDNGFHTPQIRD